MGKPDFTIDEVDAELRQMAREMEGAYKRLNRGQSDPGATMNELARAWGIGPSGAKKRITRLKGARMVIEGKRYIERKDGYWRPVPVYLFKRPAEEGDKDADIQ